jgi:hypothetical protein
MPVGRDRDLRLDVFRGLAMLIIFVAHVPGNSWSDYIPARFGFSSAAEMFVFCSGFASSLAFGSVFVRRGWLMGTVRVLYRIWQLYWAHVGLALVLATISIVAVRLHIGPRDYQADLSLDVFASDGLNGIVGLMTLSLVPDLLNILPLYVILLAFTPLAMAVSRISPLFVFAASAALWGLVQATGLNLSAPAAGVAGRSWFFDPFAWQLMFFTGFAFGMRWFPSLPLNHPTLLPLAAAVVVLSVPITFWGFTDAAPALRSIRDWLIPDGIVATTRLNGLRYAHFLCLAYVALSLVERFPRAITASAVAPVVAIGRQSLPAFVSSVVIAWLGGMLLDVVGRNPVSVGAVNLLGFAAIFAAARFAAWLKSTPWAGGSARTLSRQTKALASVRCAEDAVLAGGARPVSAPQLADA